MSITIADVEAARRTIAGQVLRTPMLPAPKLSVLTGAEARISPTIARLRSRMRRMLRMGWKSSATTLTETQARQCSQAGR